MKKLWYVVSIIIWSGCGITGVILMFRASFLIGLSVLAGGFLIGTQCFSLHMVLDILETITGQFYPLASAHRNISGGLVQLKDDIQDLKNQMV